MNRPASVVTSSVVTLVSWLVTTTVAPGRTALCWSVTVPVMVAERIWATATDEHDRLNRTNSEQSRCFSTTDLPSLIDPLVPAVRYARSHRCAS